MRRKSQYGYRSGIGSTTVHACKNILINIRFICTSKKNNDSIKKAVLICAFHDMLAASDPRD
ncbi:hypothetical protein NC651_038319 [Populus alba x Populus x berolinensis]|nr:hypothetical protein NC651_038319 [Populus alba x Populus x berolinensis]